MIYASNRLRTSRRPVASLLAGVLLTLTSLAIAQDPVTVTSITGYSRNGDAIILGVLRNDTSTPIQFVKIVVSIYNGSDQFIDSDFTYTDMRSLYPGEWSTFDLSVRPAPDFAKYEYSIEWREDPNPDPRVITINNHRSVSERGDVRIVGQVTNTSNTSQEYVKIIGAAYDSDGNIIATDFTYTDLRTLRGGQRSPFDLHFDNIASLIDHYELTVQSRPID